MKDDLEVLVTRMEQCVAEARRYFTDSDFPYGKYFSQDREPPRRFPPFTEEEKRRVREAGWEE